MTAAVLSVDMVRCDGHGICAWLFPARVDLDTWGFAITDGAIVETDREVRAARRAVRACPRQALSLTPAVAPAATGVR
jgi:ferredoxin